MTRVQTTAAATKVLFICRGSARDGIGHVLRSRTAAAAMAELATVKMIVIGDIFTDNLLLNRDLDYSIIENEREALPIAAAMQPDILVFDLTHLDPSLFKAMCGSAMTVSLSPVFNCLQEVDILFHRTSCMPRQWPAGKGKPLVIKGLQYAIIGSACVKINERDYAQNLSSEPLSIAVSMGGTDAANKTLQVIRVLKNVRDKLLIWVFLGEGYAHSYQELVDSIKGERHEIILVKANDSMWRILNSCSLTILAGGVTTYEAAYAGLPSINLLEKKDSYFLIKELVDRGVCVCAGTSFHACLDNLISYISFFNKNRGELLKMHRRAQKLIDAHGVQRVVTEILHFHEQRRCRYIPAEN